MPILLVYLFLGFSNVIQVILYWRFINQRYVSSHMTKLIVQALSQRIDGFAARFAALALLWQRAKAGIAYLSRTIGGVGAPRHAH